MIRAYQGEHPQIDREAWVDESAQVIGKVVIGAQSGIWPLACLRGDVARIKVGSFTNIQDGTMVHVGYGVDTIIEDYVTIGHGSVIHGCTIRSGVLVGMGAIILDGAEIGENSLVAAGSLIAPGKKMPANSLIMGSPAKVVRKLHLEEIAGSRKNALEYLKLAGDYK